MAEDDQSIRFRVDAPIPENVAQALPLKNELLQLNETILDLGIDEFGRKISDAVKKVQKAFAGLEDVAGSFKVSEVTFSLSLDAGGEVSILSLAKGSLNGSAGIEVKLIKDHG